jgi:hypothetical protein
VVANPLARVGLQWALPSKHPKRSTPIPTQGAWRGGELFDRWLEEREWPAPRWSDVDDDESEIVMRKRGRRSSAHASREQSPVRTSAVEADNRRR